jgi:hypothetical protein
MKTFHRSDQSVVFAKSSATVSDIAGHRPDLGNADQS